MQSSQCFLFCYKIPNLRSLETPSDMRYYDLLHMDWKHLIFFFIVFNLNLLAFCSLNRKKNTHSVFYKPVYSHIHMWFEIKLKSEKSFFFVCFF